MKQHKREHGSLNLLEIPPLGQYILFFVQILFFQLQGGD